MGKTLIQQARGKGGPRYTTPSFNFAGETKLLSISQTLIQGNVKDIIDCPGHSAPLMIVQFPEGKEQLTIASEGIRVGDIISNGPGAEAKIGNALKLKEIPDGMLIYHIEQEPGDGGRYCRSSGTGARIITKTQTHALIELPSKKQRLFPLECRAIIGIAAGGGRTEKPFLKAGVKHYAMKARNKRYPNPSAAAQNAVDHPFGNKRTSRKARQRPTGHDAPPGRKVGKLWPKRTGRRK